MHFVGDGMGIEPELLGEIFNAFEQGGDGTTRRFGGLGLGLAISKALVEMHGGSSTAASAGRGAGRALPCGCRGGHGGGGRAASRAGRGPRPLRMLYWWRITSRRRLVMARLLRGAGTTCGPRARARGAGKPRAR